MLECTEEAQHHLKSQVCHFPLMVMLSLLPVPMEPFMSSKLWYRSWGRGEFYFVTIRQVCLWLCGDRWYRIIAQNYTSTLIIQGRTSWTIALLDQVTDPLSIVKPGRDPSCWLENLITSSKGCPGELLMRAKAPHSIQFDIFYFYSMISTCN